MKLTLLISWLPWLAFFTGSFAYFAFFSDYIFFYQEKSSLFFLSHDFLVESLSQPGGLLNWLSGFLTSFYYYPVLGALILSAVMTLLTGSVSRNAFQISGRNEKILPFIIGLILFYLHTNYRFTLEYSLGLLLQSALFMVAVKNIRYLKGWMPVIIIPFWYYATGGFSWIFVLMLTLYYAFCNPKKGWIKIFASWLIMLASVFISMEFLFFEMNDTLYFYPLTLPDDQSSRFMFKIALGLTALLPVIARLRFPVADFLSLKYSAERIIRSVLVLSVLVLIAVYGFDRKNINYFKIEKLFYEGKYEEIIEYNLENPSTNSLTLFYNNIALCEKGLLNDRLFSFLQSPDGHTLFLKWEMVTEILKRGGYFYYSIGMINEAHRWAFENMVMDGHTPEGLKLLIRTELINGNYQMASKYISLLDKTIFYKKEAIAFEKFLFNDTALESDPELGTKRKNKIRSDFFAITDNPIINVERILATDTLSRKAFEYKIAFSLIKKDFKLITAMLPEFEKLGYTRLPVHVEEAVMAISLSDSGRMPQMGNLKIRTASETRWTQFLTIFQQYGSDPRAAEPALRRQFGNTFWYWMFYK